MCQVGEYTFEITINRVNIVETKGEPLKELRFFMNLGWSQFAYLELRKTQSSFSIPLDFEIAKVACTTKKMSLLNKGKEETSRLILTFVN